MDDQPGERQQYGHARRDGRGEGQRERRAEQRRPAAYAYEYDEPATGMLPASSAYDRAEKRAVR
ncbi:hypothetical protein, partial [Streptomyces nigra]